MLAWHYERDGLRPMLIGHSQGGMRVVRTLHELAGEFHDEIAVVDPVTRPRQPRTSIATRTRGGRAAGGGHAGAVRGGHRHRQARPRAARAVDDADAVAPSSRQRAGVHRLRDRLGSARRQWRRSRTLSSPPVRARAQRIAAGVLQPHRRSRTEHLPAQASHTGVDRRLSARPRAPGAAFRGRSRRAQSDPRRRPLVFDPAALVPRGQRRLRAQDRADVRGRLNLFQAAMLRWRELYPYNAVHVAELPGTLDERTGCGRHHRPPDRSSGSRGLTLDGRGAAIEYAGGPAAGGTCRRRRRRGRSARGARAEMERAAERALRAGGRRASFDPFRFFAVARRRLLSPGRCLRPFHRRRRLDRHAAEGHRRAATTGRDPRSRAGPDALSAVPTRACFRATRLPSMSDSIAAGHDAAGAAGGAPALSARATTKFNGFTSIDLDAGRLRRASRAPPRAGVSRSTTCCSPCCCTRSRPGGRRARRRPAPA